MSERDHRQKPPAGGVCATCGKRRYLTKGSAKRAIRGFRGREGRMNAYRCGDFWHIGHMPEALRHGDITRDEIPRKNA